MPRDLRPLFDPASVAILGASDDPAKWGNWLARGALRGADRRPVYLVNRNGGEVLGERAYTSVDGAAGGARAGRDRRAGGRLRAGGRRLAGDGRPRAGGHHGRAGRGRGRRGRPRAGAGAAGARRGRDAARPQLPGRVRRVQRPRPLLERVPARLDRADLAERQPGARAGPDVAALLARLLAVRLDRQPGRPRPGRAGRLLRRASGHRADRRLRRRTSATGARSSTPRPPRRSR